LISRFLGLFLSSNRLPINQKRNLVSVTDLQRAREVQMAYLPSEYPVNEKYEIYGYNQSSALVGGDYFDYFCRRPGSIECVVADACGHGLAAALIMSTFRGLLHSEAAAEDFVSLFTRLNHEIFSGGELLQYLTAIFFEYDEATGRLRWFNAGHFDPLIVHSDGTSTLLSGGGPPLGMFRATSFEPRTAAIVPGDLMVLFTDGLVELRNESDEFFGVAGIENAVTENRRAGPRELARAVLAAASDFSSSRPPDDDLTLFVMRFR
jgi:sigma-B regulation protein RsbU (phosphoserine phosphatase)